MNETRPDELQNNPRSLEELGFELVRERERRRLSSDDISTMTCIRVNFIEDIERGNFGGFVSLVYARGFVRTYLNLLQRQDLWPEYDLQLKSLSAETSSEEKSHIEQYQSSSVSPGKGYRRKSSQRLAALCCLAIVVCCVLLWSNRESFQTVPSVAVHEAEGPAWTSAPEPEEIPEIVPPQEGVQPTAAEPAEGALTEEPPSSEALAEPVAEPAEKPLPEPQQVQPTLTVRALGDCWFQLRQGSRTIRERTIRSGYEETFDLSEPLRVVFGAGHNVRVTVNGEDRGSPGRRVVRMEYRPDGTATPFRNP